ncbi:hypothetical protein BDFB_008000 [Asbolus verrucosus]|uniref:Uncharacterized protein n=1 Tax=Asbolus verrucosus TaxID=1661398 RepID=A0A482W9Q7_ASBVE|nr:hypothetical protein BDFB_008000 [Asbolus verrucosus]
MRTYILLVILQIIVFCHWSSASTAGVEQRKTSVLVKLIGQRLRTLWTWLRGKGETEDGFVGRCIGVARRLKFVMPLIVFKLGVIVTTLTFLTIFALKSLGLLVLLVMINTSGLAAKFTHLKHEETKQWTQPQNVHFHLHSKGGHYGGYERDQGWYDKNDFGSDDETLADRLKKLNFYETSRKF